MKKQRDWLDYAQLVSSVAQNAQLSGIGESLEQLKQTELLKLEKGERIERLRQALMRLEDRITEADETQEPRVKLYRLRGKVELAEYYLPLISTYEDKDRHSAIMNRLQAAIADVQQSLSPEDVTDVDRAIKYNPTIAAIKGTIKFHVLKEKIETKEKEAAAAKMEKAANDQADGIPKRLGSLILTAVGIGLLVMAFVRVAIADDPGEEVTSLLLCPIGLLLLAIVGFWNRKSLQIHAESTAKIEAAEKELGALQGRLPQPALIKLYDKMLTECEPPTLDGLRTLYQERVDLVNRVAGAKIHKQL